MAETKAQMVAAINRSTAILSRIESELKGQALFILSKPKATVVDIQPIVNAPVTISGHVDGLEGLLTTANAQHTEGGLTTAQWLEDIEADVDGLETRLDLIESSLNTLIAANATDFAASLVQLTATAVSTAGILLAAGVAALATIVTNGHLSDHTTLLTAMDADTNLIQQRLTFGGKTNAESLTEIKGDTQAIQVAVEDIETQTRHQQTGTYIYSAVVTALAIANLRLQWDFAGAGSRAKLRAISLIRTAGSATPVLDFTIYNQDVAQDVTSEISVAGSATHRQKLSESDATPMGGQNVGRLDAGLLLNFTPDVYDLVMIFEVTRDTLPTVTNWGTAHTISSVNEAIVGLNEASDFTRIPH